MKLNRIFLTGFVFFALLQVCFGQNTPELVEDETWVTKYGLYPASYVTFRYDRYSREDTVKFREKLDLLKTAKSTDEWEGDYFSDLEQLGKSNLRLNSEVGFTSFYFYGCMLELSHIDYGKIVNTPEYIQLISETAGDSPRKAGSVKYIKVKWDKWRYLVEESALAAFAEKAVGIYVEPNDEALENKQNWSDYWINDDPSDDEFVEKEFTGLPEFPASYKKFQRQPLAAKLVAVGKRTFEAGKTFGDGGYTRYFEDSAIYPVTIDAGRNKGVKPGIVFRIPETGEEVFITEVKQNTASGFVARNTNEDKNDKCYDNNGYGDPIPCPALKPSLTVKTQIGKFWF